MSPADQLMSVSDNTRNNLMSLQQPPTGVRELLRQLGTCTGTMVEVRDIDIVTPMMHYDVMLHLASVYIGLSCASVSVVVLFEAELSCSGTTCIHIDDRTPHTEQVYCTFY